MYTLINYATIGFRHGNEEDFAVIVSFSLCLKLES